MNSVSHMPIEHVTVHIWNATRSDVFKVFVYEHLEHLLPLGSQTCNMCFILKSKPFAYWLLCTFAHFIQIGMAVAITLSCTAIAIADSLNVNFYWR